MPNQVDLKLLFANLQASLAGDLALARSAINHPGDKGAAVEANWLGMLVRHLPERYRADKATVIDNRGNCSDSIDIVVYDGQYTHLVLKHQDFLYVLAEPVYAVFEVKQSVDKSHAGDKAASVRGLHRTSAATVDIRGATALKPPIPILAGLLCTDSGVVAALRRTVSRGHGGLGRSARLTLGATALKPPIPILAGLLCTDSGVVAALRRTVSRGHSGLGRSARLTLGVSRELARF
ncbi:DUF6602 domain-containing protein [Paraburkholderia sp. BL10I2N1]|uniref:DUF6602 domain-containing protein n=1 Tax=Paraburkholderia sp. BL10I2N1 TaxID=1938796 RepID=UPI00105D7ED2|nr:DUF6602 domain-containing protein [Paraburkholderia sp. BL10I2N1]TDN59111.1 hypothetical protein B0G77_8300 [Paraburkholderia sp. BL10I2N1]